MPQEHKVMAFRKRLKSAGYTNIRIFRDDSWINRDRDLYIVSAVEPLAGQTVRVSLSSTQMYHAFQRQRGGILSSAYPKSGGGIPSSASPASGAGIPSSGYPVLKAALDGSGAEE